MSVERIVIDASAALKWVLRDEEATAEADALLKDLVAGKIELLVSTLFDYEISNALKVAVLKQRISEVDVLTAITKYQQLNAARHEFIPIQIAAFRLACQYQRSAYDAAYLALAQANNAQFYTGDKRLFNAVSKALTWVKWIGDYRI